jgi:hypothetical protein
VEIISQMIRMQNDTSKYVVNIVPLQNVISNTSGVNPTTTLQTQMAAVKLMVNTDLKRINANSIAAYTPNTAIKVLSPLVDANSAAISGSGSTGTIQTTNTVLTVSDDSASVMSVANSGNTLMNLTTTGVTFGGICYAQSFVTLSDYNSKKGIRDWNYSNNLDKLNPYIFTYSTDSSKHECLGLMAQEVAAVYPECVKENGKLFVNYDSIVTVLLAAVKDLSARVTALEA